MCIFGKTLKNEANKGGVSANIWLGRLCIVILTVLVSACDPKSESTPLDKEASEVEAVAPVAEDPMPSESADKSVNKQAVSPKATKHEDKKPKKKLNLTLSDDVVPGVEGTVSHSEAAIDVENNNKLPNMFGKQEKGTTYGGGLLRDEENEDYVDSIQGAEVNIEIKID